MPDEAFAPPKPPDPFIGRKSELEWIEQQISDREVGYGRPLVITGVAGIGKSSLVAKYLESPRPLIITGRPGPGKTWELIRRERERETRTIWMPARQYPQNAREFDSLMRSRFDERIPGSAVVVLDGADEIEREEERHRAVSQILNFKLVRTLIITTRTELELRGQRTLRLEGLPRADAELLIVDLAQTSVSSASLQGVLGVADGRPRLLKLLGYLAKSRNDEELRELLAGHIYDFDKAAIVPQRKLISVAKPVIISANEAMIKALRKQPKDIYTLTPRQYEELVAELFRDMGYDVTLTKATRDGGKDILAAIKTEIGQLLCLIEAKHYREHRKIGVSLVRSLLGTLQDHGATSAMLVTTSCYSKDAHAMQQRHQYQLSLKEYAHVADWIQRYGTNKRIH